ncbi:F-box domain cyclin-like protein [Macrophomina phaseolina MS6]|uniref:F-box domain cyclin-like protein n=1 Tax=Macrophomina phaseolina (strain MS6) TaxID=1126212 RepID=K2S6L7_MACPH|nr:F-box domain cyclin-like protein [Macrophomina phaseolina MS6]
MYNRQQLHRYTPPTIPRPAVVPTTEKPALDRLPQEMWDEVMGYLSRDDLKALSLTSVRMRTVASKALFNIVVIPFRQGMFGEELRAEMKNHAGKGKAKSTAINIFKSHGHHIKKFGISYEVNEARLAHLPKLIQHDLLESYWGTYEWPSAPVHQPDDMPASVMEEIVGIKEAFADMTSLQELALSIDNGLGWLPGPDKSIRSQIIHDRIQLFTNSYGLPTRSRQAQQELWDFVKSHYEARENLKELPFARLFRIERPGYWNEMSAPYTGIAKELQHLDRRILMEAAVPENESTQFLPHSGFLAVAKDSNWSRTCTTHPIQPGNLTEAQLEFLLKTQWAQDSLIDSYIIGVIDSETCRGVKSLNLACIPGRCIQFLDRADFWDALPCLESLKIMVMGEIRYVGKDVFGAACSDPAVPLKPVPIFRSLLADSIAPRSNIKHLTIGYVSGGEHATGLLARNRHLLPAAFLDVAAVPSPSMMDDVNIFPHVEHLTITNCWMTPRSVELLVAAHRELSMTKLTLDSVSLQIIPAGVGGQTPAPLERIANPVAGRPTLVFPQREGSWPNVLDAISPGEHFGSWRCETRNYGNKASLNELELVSCGYSVLEANGWGLDSMDREFINANTAAADDMEFSPNSRRAVLEPVMLKVRDMHLGTIIQHIPAAEANVLETMWRATFGWTDGDHKHAVSLDGLREGGTGRFSAVIRPVDLDESGPLAEEAV